MSHADHLLRAARAAIAAACLDALPNASLGEIRLRDDQRRIVARAQRAIARHGGCLVAEDVGRGKTYIALTLARGWKHPLVVMPAALRSLWSAAAQRAEIDCAFASHESLSRGRAPGSAFDGIIVDESHHYRNPGTRRYSALAGLATSAPLVLLSATPLQNSVRDLATQIALFLGERAFALDMPALARVVIRGAEPMDVVMPVVSTPEWIETEVDDGRILNAILDLPPPARVLDGGDAGALRTINLVRAWSSSRAALEATLRSRRRIATAVEQGVQAGRAPTRREARAWLGADDVVQLGFASLLMCGTASNDMLDELRSALEQDRDAMSRLWATIRHAPDPDPARIAALLRLRTAHPSSRIIAFSEYASTVARYFSVLRGEAGVGMLTAKEARIASGGIARDEMLQRFAPIAQRARPTAPHEAVTLLLATDLLSEGVNLQDASVVVHLDLPWNPARLAQRVGRVRRPGGAAEVRSYLLAPPARSGALLRAETRLRRKHATAESVVGASFSVMPALSRQSALDATAVMLPHDPLGTSADAEGAFIARLAEWRTTATASGGGRLSCVAAAVQSSSHAWLAALDDGRVLWSLGGGVRDAMAGALRVADLTGSPAREPTEEEVHTVLAGIHEWLAAEHFSLTCGIGIIEGRLRRSVRRWMSALTGELPRHQRAVALPLLARLRTQLVSSLPLGVEMQLAQCAQHAAGADSVSRLSAVVQLAESALRYRPRIAETDCSRVVALIIVGRPDGPVGEEQANKADYDVAGTVSTADHRC